MARAGPLTWSETGAGPSGETGAVAADPAAWGDVILARKDTPTSYHLAVVVDDAAQGVTDVVRGHDLFHATSRAPAAAEPARPARAALSPPPADPRRRRQQAVEIDASHGLARAARARRNAGRYPPSGRARLSVALSAHCRPGSAMAKRRRKKQRKRARGARRAQRAAAPQRARVEAALAGIAHDIRTPLTGIVALAELLASSDLRRARTRVGERHQERRRASRRAHDADRRCRQGRCRRPHAAARAVLAARAGRSGRRSADRARRNKSIKAEIAIADDLPAMVAGDALRLRAALENLADNAVKFTGKAASPSRRAPSLPRASACGSIFTVTDSGIGMSAADIEAAVPPVRAGQRRYRPPLRRRRPRPVLRQAHRQGDGRRSQRHQQARRRLDLPLHRAGRARRRRPAAERTASRARGAAADAAVRRGQPLWPRGDEHDPHRARPPRRFRRDRRSGGARRSSAAATTRC